MLSKVLTGGFILIMLGAIVAGAIAVFSPSEQAHAVAQARNSGTRLGQGAQAETYQGQGQGLGRGQGQGQGQGQGRNQSNSGVEATPLEIATVEGVVVETNELVIETASGETVQIGLGPISYRESMGFVLNTGENARVSGYWENDEFKATEVENQTTGQSIILRDATGRPMWAGQGRGRNRSS